MLSLRSIARPLKEALKARIYALLPDAWLSSLVRRKLPKLATLEVTTACNLHCPLCFTHEHERSERMLKEEHVESVLSACGKRLKFVCFHMQGEPMVHRQLFEFVRRCASTGIGTGFSSNGMLIDRYLSEIFDSGLSYLSVAIDGCDAEDYDKYRQGGDFERVVGGVRKLVSERKSRGLDHPTLQVQAIMFPYNEDREQELCAFLDSLGADDVRLKNPTYGARGSDIELSPQSLAFLELTGADREERKYARPRSQSGELFRNKRICPLLERAAVLSDGRIVACCMDSLGMTCFGDLNEESFADAWRGPRHQQLLDDFMGDGLELCSHCNLS